MIRQNAAGRRGQILHLTAYRPIGNGELGSMPPYYPPLAPFFPGFGVVFRPLVPLLCQGQIFAFNGLQMLRLPARIQLTLLVRDEAGILYHTDPVSLKW